MQLLESSSHDVLVSRRGSGKNFELVSDQLEVFDVLDDIGVAVFVQSTYEIAELSTSHDSVVVFTFLDPFFGEDACFLGDCDCSCRVVSGDHADGHSGLVALLDSVGDGFSDGVFDADHADDDEVAFDLSFF